MLGNHISFLLKKLIYLRNRNMECVKLYKKGKGKKNGIALQIFLKVLLHDFNEHSQCQWLVKKTATFNNSFVDKII